MSRLYVLTLTTRRNGYPPMHVARYLHIGAINVPIVLRLWLARAAKLILITYSMVPMLAGAITTDAINLGTSRRYVLIAISPKGTKRLVRTVLFITRRLMSGLSAAIMVQFPPLLLNCPHDSIAYSIRRLKGLSDILILSLALKF